jgi:hypothetical protein
MEQPAPFLETDSIRKALAHPRPKIAAALPPSGAGILLSRRERTVHKEYQLFTTFRVGIHGGGHDVLSIGSQVAATAKPRISRRS